MIFQRTSGVTYRDFLFLAVIGFVAMVVLMYPLLQPPVEPTEGADPPGNLIVALYWPEGDIDIDVWLLGPGDIAPVGYSNKSGKLFNLLRDDLGFPDKDRNYENAFTRGIVAGEYIINLHLFRGTAPVTVDVEISVNTGKPGKSDMKRLLTTKVELKRYGEEKTAVRFLLDAEGNITPGTTNSVFRPLRAANAGAL